MGLIKNQEIEIELNSRNIKNYEKLGYLVTRNKDKWNRMRVPKGSKIKVKIEHLSENSHVYVKVTCDACETELSVKYQNYNNYKKEDGSYYCNLCSKNNNQKWISFEQKCYELFEKEKAEDVLNRWDYDLNDLSPSEIPYGTGKSFYFKCPREIHKSELKDINSFTSNKTINIDCKKCNSFAQWGIDNLGEDFLEKYWSYKDNVNIDPWEISYGTPNINIIIKCQKDNDRHSHYKTTPNLFTGSEYRRCPLCGFDSKSGENAYQWKGGITELNHFLRKALTQWNKDSIDKCNYKCVITGGKFHAVHHLKGFHLIVQETLNKLKLPIYNTLGKYSFDELQQIKDKCLELHYKYGLGVCLSEHLHNLFHSLFGRSNNTPEQFEEFRNNYNNGLYTDLLKDAIKF